MGKQSGKGKKQLGSKSRDSNAKQKKANGSSPRAYDKDTAVFISMSRELKDEGNSLFQKRDYEGAMLKCEKAIKLLPRNHVDVSNLRSNIATCYMQMGLTEYPRAIHECNLALEVTPKYSKALLKRARCYEALNRLDLALRDVGSVLKMEPNNVMATEVSERIKATIEKRGAGLNEIPLDLIPVPDYVEPKLSLASHSRELKDKLQKKETKVIGDKKADKESEEKHNENEVDEKKEPVKIEEKAEGNRLKEKDKTEEKAEGNGLKEEDKIEEKAEGNGQRELDEVEKKAEGNGLKEEDEVEEKAEGNGLKEEDKIEEKAEGNGLKKSDKIEEKAEGRFEKDELEKIEEKGAEDKLVVEERISNSTEVEVKRTVKLVFGEDIRCAEIPVSCSVLKLREVIRDRFPNLNSILIKYRDQEGDLVTITTTDELRWAEASAEHGSVRLNIVEVDQGQDPLFHKVPKFAKKVVENGDTGKGNEPQNRPSCIEDWIVQFAQIFKNYVGFDSDEYLDLHEVGMKLYSEAMDDAVTSEEAQGLFSKAAEKFREMTALALFNWGNVHMSRARKSVYSSDDSSRESMLLQVKTAYDWAQKEYSEAGRRYEEAVKFKPDFYEGILALGQQQFEQAKLRWYFAISTNVDLETWPSTELLQLYNNAEENMEKGMQMWEEDQRRSNDSKTTKVNDLFKEISAEEVAEQAANTRSQINLLWGTMLYERSMMEFKLEIPVWHECLEVAIEKFELAGASPTDIAVMVKNHCSNNTAIEGLGFNIDEIVQAWNEMYEAKRLLSGVPSFRLESLLRRRVSKLYHALEHA